MIHLFLWFVSTASAQQQQQQESNSSSEEEQEPNSQRVNIASQQKNTNVVYVQSSTNLKHKAQSEPSLFFFIICYKDTQ